MANRRKRKSRAKNPADPQTYRDSKTGLDMAVSPDPGPRERWQHGGFDVIDPATIEGTVKTARQGQTRRARDALASLHIAGSITDEQLAAGRVFGVDFAAAGLTARVTSRYQPATGHQTGETMTQRRIDASARITSAMIALGGIGTRTGAAAWNVLGEQASLREWSDAQTLMGRSMHERQAANYLVACLDILVEHYGGEMRRGRPGRATIGAQLGDSAPDTIVANATRPSAYRPQATTKAVS